MRQRCRQAASDARSCEAETLGCYGEYVERLDEIRPALSRSQREVDRGSVALVNVKTDDRARATTVTFAQYAT